MSSIEEAKLPESYPQNPSKITVAPLFQLGSLYDILRPVHSVLPNGDQIVGGYLGLWAPLLMRCGLGYSCCRSVQRISRRVQYGETLAEARPLVVRALAEDGESGPPEGCHEVRPHGPEERMGRSSGPNGHH